jgi:hypothetical protein
MPAWTDVTLGYAVYLTALAWLVPRFSRARRAAAVALLVSLALWLGWSPDSAEPASAVTWVVIPSLTVLGTYRVSGAFLVKPSLGLERWLLAIDDRLLRTTGVLRAYDRAPWVASEIFELFYVLVYAVVPAGATVLLLGGSTESLGRYWTTVFVAEVLCYAALPWLQSRPPRVLELPPPPERAGPIRRLNLWLLRHGSIQANTLPSAHAAGALAVGLAVYSAMPAVGLVFITIAIGITLATVLGRYHYAIDSILGAAVAIATWLVVGA